MTSNFRWSIPATGKLSMAAWFIDEIWSSEGWGDMAKVTRSRIAETNATTPLLTGRHIHAYETQNIPNTVSYCLTRHGHCDLCHSPTQTLLSARTPPPHSMHTCPGETIPENLASPIQIPPSWASIRPSGLMLTAVCTISVDSSPGVT